MANTPQRNIRYCLALRMSSIVCASIRFVTIMAMRMSIANKKSVTKSHWKRRKKVPPRAYTDCIHTKRPNPQSASQHSTPLSATL